MIRWMKTAIDDARYGVRILRRSPGFTAVVTLSLALGIGANTAIFSLINAVMLRSLPVERPGELFAITIQNGGALQQGFTYRKYRLLRDAAAPHLDLAASSAVRLNISIGGSIEPPVEGLLVSGSYFGVLGVNPAAGRTIGPGDDRTPGGHPVAMISYGYWKRRFGLAGSAIGRQITIDGAPFSIIGVTPPEFFGIEVGRAPDVWVPLMMQQAVMPAAENWLDRPINTAYWLRLAGRLRPGANAAHTAAELDVVYHRDSPPEDPVTAGERLRLAPAAQGVSDLRRQLSKPLFVLMSVVGILLLIACANVAGLLLARATARRQELAVRLAVGAERRRLVRQLLVESVVLSALGGACGVLLAFWGSHALVAMISRGRSPLILDAGPDLRVLGFTLLISLATGLLFGLAPALRGSRIDLTPALKARSQANVDRRGLRFGNALVSAQVAMSLLLLVAAGLFAQTLVNLNAQDAGFARESVLITRIEPKGSDQKSRIALALDRTYRNLIERTLAIPGVRSASLAGSSPTARGLLATAVTTESGDQIRVGTQQTYPGYFATLGLPVLAGRDFGEADLSPNAPLVAVINETMARRVFGARNPLGRRYQIRRRSQPAWREVIGVVEDSRYSDLRGEAQSVAYQPFLQTDTGRGQMTLHVRVAGDARAILTPLREAIQQIDKDLPAFDIQTLAAEVDAALVQERMIATLAGFFGAVALLLAGVGLYGLMAFAVERRTGEIGIRMAVGARPSDILRMVLGATLAPVAVGVAIGIPAAVALARILSSQVSGMLFGLSPTDPWTIAGAASILAVTALVAGYVPARRAATVDPIEVLNVV